jgi:hypothetical protein
MDDNALPTVVYVSQSFASRMPSQRLLDAIAAIDGTPFGELAQRQPSRLTAFRALQRDHPDRDMASLWLHSYDTEVELVEVDPTGNGGRPPWPPSAITGISTPTS